MSGSITLRLRAGTIAIAGRRSEHALYDERWVTFGEDDVYQQHDAAGFIRLFGLAQRVRALKDREGLMPRAPGAGATTNPAVAPVVTGGQPESADVAARGVAKTSEEEHAEPTEAPSVLAVA